ncbi:MAG: DUF4115 domain-containing protein, partial [Alphaproteobacteria bacterium]|nr:DUF4115 domain-containing protein [Alphaproteobacteria bacterium]
FIKSYASYLALDVNAIIVQYKQETGGFSQSSALSTEDENILIKDPAINSNHIIIAGIIVLLGIIFVSFTSSKDATDVIEKTEQPAEDVEISIQSDNISSNESVDADVQTIVFPAKETTKEEMKISTPEYFETNMSTITSVEPEKKEEVKAEEKVVEEVVVPETHVAREYGLENKDDSNIYIKATKKVWIKLKKDGLYKYDNEQGDIGSGVTVFETILDDGDTYYVPQGDNYYLTIGNAQGIDIYANGEKIAPLSKKEVSRHNIEMNVEKLKNGTAYVRNRVIE